MIADGNLHFSSMFGFWIAANFFAMLGEDEPTVDWANATVGWANATVADGDP